MSGGSRCSIRRSALVVSPERTPTEIGGTSWFSRRPRRRDADERCPQVALDVDAERLERGDVQHAGSVLRVVVLRRRGEPIERPEERGEGLARPGRRDDERVTPRRDRIPRPRLRGSRLGERAREPLPRGGGEALERGVHPAIFPRTAVSRRALLALGIVARAVGFQGAQATQRRATGYERAPRLALTVRQPTGSCAGRP